MRKVCLLFTVIVLLSQAAFAQGGPPMLTDDSGTPGDGKWENNIAFIFEGSKSDYSIALPVLDLNYGVGERLQLNIAAPWTSEKGEPLANRFDNISPGVKYRFFDEEVQGFDASVYPHLIFSFNTEDPSKKMEYGAILPVAVSKEIFSLQWNLQIGYQVIDKTSELFYGLVAGKKIGKSCLLMAEFHQAFDRELHLSERDEVFLKNGSFLNLGTQYEVSELLTLLGAFGKDLDTGANGESRYYGFAGLQFHF